MQGHIKVALRGVILMEVRFEREHETFTFLFDIAASYSRSAIKTFFVTVEYKWKHIR